jgi:hypothetical protein
MPQQSTIHIKPSDVANRLRELGISEAVLRTAVIHSHVEVARCTKNDPKALPGYLYWAKTTGFLRDELAGAGWEPDFGAGSEPTVRPGGKVAVVVANGDANTGRRGVTPTTKHTKGRVMELAVQANSPYRVMSFSDLEPSFPAVDPLPDRLTWILLLYVLKDQEIRLELSLPDGIDTNGHVVSWGERLILTPISLAVNQTARGNPPSMINVPVRRRQP